MTLSLFGIGMKIDLFQSCNHCWVFLLHWHIKCSTLTASSFTIWNSLIGIPSPPLAVFIVMLPEAHLTYPSRISGSRWVDHSIVVIWVFKIFYVLFFHVFLPPLLLGLNHFCPLIMLNLVWNISLILPIFLKRYLVFSKLFYLPLFLCIFHWRRPSYLSSLISGALHSIE